MEVEEPLDTADPNVEDVEGTPFLAHSSRTVQSDGTESKSASGLSSLSWNSADSLANMYRMRPNLCDVCLISDDGHRIYAHRIVLASAIQYFSTMFVGPDCSTEMDRDGPECSAQGSVAFIEQSKYEILIHNVDGPSLNEIIKYCYLGTVVLREDSVQSLMVFALMINCSDVIRHCTIFLKSKIEFFNVLKIFDFADMVGALELKEVALSYILSNFVRISSPQNEEYQQLSPDRLAEIISSDCLDTGEFGEREVLRALNTWILVAPEQRRPFLPQLLKHIRFPRFREEALLGIENEFPLITTEPVFKDLLIEALRYHLCKSNANVNSFKLNWSRTLSDLHLESLYSKNNSPWMLHMFDLTNSRFRERIPRIPQNCLIVVGGQAPKAIRKCEYFDFPSNKWIEFPCDLPTRRCRSGIAVLNNSIYAIGGFNGSARVRSVEVFDPNVNQWVQCASLEARRSTLGACVLDGKIFAIGGFDGTIGLQSAEVYNPITKSWRFIAPMSTRRSSVAVAALNNFIFAVGGYDGLTRQCLNSAEKYSPEFDSWERIPDMSVRRSGAAVGVLEGKLWAIGGHDGPAVRKSVECYDPQTNVWRECANLNVGRRNPGCVAKDGLLYVTGGDDGQSNLTSMEVYDPQRNQWKLMPDMIIGRSYASVAIVPRTWQ